jgi:hypothetical protein
MQAISKRIQLSNLEPARPNRVKLKSELPSSRIVWEIEEGRVVEVHEERGGWRYHLLNNYLRAGVDSFPSTTVFSVHNDRGELVLQRRLEVEVVGLNQPFSPRLLQVEGLGLDAGTKVVGKIGVGVWDGEKLVLTRRAKSESPSSVVREPTVHSIWAWRSWFVAFNLMAAAACIGVCVVRAWSARRSTK